MKNYQTVAIILAHKQSKRIPRKFTRFLNNKPLLSYSISTALNCSGIDKIYVVTGDNEVAEIASRYGVQTILSDSYGPTESNIVEHVYFKLKEEYNSNIDYLVIINPSAPLLNSRLIDNAINKCKEEKFDKVISIYKDSHSYLTKDYDDSIVPLTEQNETVKNPPDFYRITNGLVIQSCEALENSGNTSFKIGTIETNRVQSIELIDFYDWWLAEKSLTRRKVCFHIIGNKEYGLGHVYRALTIADRLIDHDLWFLVNSNSQLAEQMIRERFYPVVSVSPGEEINTIISDAPHLVINDVLDTDEFLLGPLKEAGIATINFEDMGSGCSLADYVINAMYDDPVAHTAKNTLSGAKYCCLRDEFYSIRPKKVGETVGNILLLFGGTDPNDLTLKCLNWIDQLEGEWSITVILGLGFSNPEKVFALTKKLKHKTEIVQKTSVISRYMAKADIAVTSSGRTVFELGSLGVPMIAIAENEREMTHDFVQKSPGVIFLGSVKNITCEVFCNTITQLISSKILRSKMNQCLLESGIRHGIKHVIGVIESVLQKTANKLKG